MKYCQVVCKNCDALTDTLGKDGAFCSEICRINYDQVNFVVERFVIVPSLSDRGFAVRLTLF